MIKAIEKSHWYVPRAGHPFEVRLSAYKKKGSYKVSKGPNIVSAEVPCDTLEQVLQYAGKGYMIRMHSEIMDLDGKRRRVNGLYSSDGIEVIR
ncbi:MAG: hypothetical protein H6917_09900 [Novosphingobium sp.]|nr:hypothetical protein [Novosphingobium sp.]